MGLVSNALIVEDNPDIQLLLESILDHYNILHSSVSTIALAKLKIEYSIPAIIILDNSLPDGKGVDFIEFLCEKYPCIKIVLFTSDYIDIHHGKLKGKVYLYAQKPFIDSILEMCENKMNWQECEKSDSCFPQNCHKFHKNILT